MDGCIGQLSGDALNRLLLLHSTTNTLAARRFSTMVPYNSARTKVQLKLTIQRCKMLQEKKVSHTNHAEAFTVSDVADLGSRSMLSGGDGETSAARHLGTR